MGLSTLNTILNTAPMIIQGATKLINLLKQREAKQASETCDIPANIDDMKSELEVVHKRLDAQNDSSLEQVKLIEELAKQNEIIAASLRTSVRQLNFISLVAVIALVIAITCLAWLVFRDS
ncbi:MAG: hypothetical protein MI673_01750 [Thiotrichales bacterium]|nr:hypothetical protein [Thiotrichales bacterium]